MSDGGIAQGPEPRPHAEVVAWNDGYRTAIGQVVDVLEGKGWLHDHDQRLRETILDDLAEAEQ